MDHIAFRLFLNHHGAVADFDRFQPQAVHEPQKVIQLVSHKEGLKQGSARIHHQPGIVVQLDFFFDIGGDDGGAKTQFQQVHFVRIDFEKIFRLTQAEAFVHDHGQA